MAPSARMLAAFWSSASPSPVALACSAIAEASAAILETCGSAGNVNAFGINSTSVAALMATLLVSHFGVAPAIAAVIAYWNERITTAPAK
jgi:hypothetical protein